MARIPTAANVAPAPSVSDPGVRVPAMGQEVAQAGVNIGSDLSTIATRRQKVSDAVDRVQKTFAFQEEAFRAYSDWERSGEVADEGRSQAFVSELTTKARDIFAEHQGDEESRMRLQADLESARLDYTFKVATASTLARRQVLLDSINKDVSARGAAAFRNPAELGSAIASFDAQIDGFEGALADTVLQEVRTRGRAELTRAAVDGAIARGDFSTANALLSDSSPYSTAIPAGEARQYRAQLMVAKKVQAKDDAVATKLENLRVGGVEITPAITAAVNGIPEWAFKGSQDDNTPSPKAKLLAEYEQNMGRKATELELAILYGMAPSTSASDGPTSTARKAAELATLLGRPLTEAEVLRVFGAAPSTSASDGPTSTARKAEEAARLLGRPLTEAEVLRVFGAAPSTSASDGPTNTAKEIAEYETRLGRPATEEELRHKYKMDLESSKPSEAAKKLREFSDLMGRPPTEAEIRREYKQEAAKVEYADPDMRRLTEEINFRAASGLPPLSEAEVLARLPSGNKPSGLGNSTTALSMERVTTQWREYQAGSLSPLEEDLYDGALALILQGTTDPVTGRRMPGALPPNVYNAVVARGGEFTDDGRLTYPNGKRLSDPAGLGGDTAPPPLMAAPPSDTTTRAAAAGDPEAQDNLIRSADLFGNAENIAGIVAGTGRAVAGSPIVGDLFVHAPQMVQAGNRATLVRDRVARALQQSPKFAAMELSQIKAELGDFASAWTTAPAFRNRMVALDSELAVIEAELAARVKDKTLPAEERQRARVGLADVELARDGLGVKRRRVNSPEEFKALPPGTMAIIPEPDGNGYRFVPRGTRQ